MLCTLNCNVILHLINLSADVGCQHVWFCRMGIVLVWHSKHLWTEARQDVVFLESQISRVESVCSTLIFNLVTSAASG